MEALIKNVPHAQPFALSQQVDYQPGKVVSLTLAQQPGVGITLFAFDAGEAISTHAAGGDAMATVLEGKVDAVLLTGGVVHNEYIVEQLKKRVGFIAPVYVYPGEREMLSLGQQTYYALTGKEEVFEL